ncbi:MAG: DUF692 family protein [Bradyrhizobium sp.]|uniref:multinuclear nonheme iron-dependent oxidase n=1 Tax=Bradyrhizobium sp. TaxID=376 RepID=UPI001227EBA3|nr:DUF692 family multinuclear iron-containing protein [Bradyrhizobium sp.]THD61160.1 MAG: DUF692 family protein [Bradyrhizobium sp.]
MDILVGGSIRKVLGREMLDAASRWPVCEVVPENWNPDDPSDVQALTSLNSQCKILLHSLSLNVLGPSCPHFVTWRVQAWSRILGINLVTDHFCWSATDAHSLGVFVPPIDDIDVLKIRVRALKQMIGMPFGLENICLSANDPIFSSRYHRALTQVCRDEGVSVLVDLENLRLDTLSSGASFDELFSYYDDVEICGYHVAGSTAGDLVLDTHDQPVPDQTLQLLLKCFSARPGPVIYERDYALDVTEISNEIRRIAAYLEGGLGTPTR